MHAGELPNCGYMMLVGGICHLCVCPSGMTPCSTPPALMHIWTIHTHMHPYEGTAERNCPPFCPSSLLLDSSPPSCRASRLIQVSTFLLWLLFHLFFLFSLWLSPSVFESHWTTYRFVTFGVILSCKEAIWAKLGQRVYFKGKEVISLRFSDKALIIFIR